MQIEITPYNPNQINELRKQIISYGRSLDTFSKVLRIYTSLFTIQGTLDVSKSQVTTKKTVVHVSNPLLPEYDNIYMKVALIEKGEPDETLGQVFYKTKRKVISPKR